MKKNSALRALLTLTASSLLLCTMALTASADEDGQLTVDDPVVAASISTSQLPKYPTTARYLGLLFQRAV